MVDRATRYQNAVNQIQGRNKPGQPQAAVDIPDNTLERHVKAVCPVSSYLAVQFLKRITRTGSPTHYGSSNR
jgi:hypothetical protein